MEDIQFHQYVSGVEIFYTNQCESTQTLCVSLVENKLKSLQTKTFHLPIVSIFTCFQTNGRGQGGHQWKSEPGKNLAFTIAIPLTDQIDFVVLNKSLTLSVCEFIQSFLEEKVVIKWPNDILCNYKKIAGLLFQVQTIDHIKYLVFGIGLNVEQTNWLSELPNAASLKDFGVSNLNFFNLAESLCKSIVSGLDSVSNPFIHQLFQQKLMNLNQSIRIQHADNQQIYEVTLLDVDQFGRILVSNENGEKVCYHHGQVFLRI